jgi:phosphate transport system permease protein
VSVHQFGSGSDDLDVDPVAGQFGAFPFIWGTLYSSFLALCIATPVAIGIAIFLSELCPNWLRAPLIFLTELLAAIPSIIYGLWGIFVLVPQVRNLQMALPEWLTALPLFSGPPVGVSMLTASIVLAIMIVPFGVRRTGGPQRSCSQREAAYVVPTLGSDARSPLARVVPGAIMLGSAARSAPAAADGDGNRPKGGVVALRPHTMAAVVANEFAEAADDLHLSALIEIGLVLFIITLVVNFLSRLLIWNITRERRGRPALTAAVPAEESAA